MARLEKVATPNGFVVAVVDPERVAAEHAIVPTTMVMEAPGTGDAVASRAWTATDCSVKGLAVASAGWIVNVRDATTGVTAVMLNAAEVSDV
jgi:hypothetical protein